MNKVIKIVFSLICMVDKDPDMDLKYTGLVTVLCLQLQYPGLESESFAKTRPGNELSDMKPAMHQMFFNLRDIYNLSLQEKKFTSESLRPEIIKKFDRLQKHAASIATHGSKEFTLKSTGQSLTKDIAQAHKFFNHKNYQESEFIIRNMVSNCFSCHTRFENKSSFPEPFIQKSLEKNLNMYELARLKVATRQFSEAAKLFETLLNNNEFSYDELASEGVLSDYFRLMIRVFHNFDQPIEICKKQLARKNLDPVSQDMLNKWLKDLNQFKNERYFSITPTLLQAKNVLDQVRIVESEDILPAHSLILLMTGSATLHQLILDKSIGSKQKSEAYFLLGTVENMMENSFWLNESQHYWEASIRTLPHSEFAGKSFDVLKDKVSLGYTGSGGTRIPDEVASWLTALEKLSAPLKNHSKKPANTPRG